MKTPTFGGIHNYLGVLNTIASEETAVAVGYFNTFPGGARQAILLKGGGVSTGADSTEVIIADNIIKARAKGNTESDIVLTGVAYNGGSDTDIFEITGDGNLQFSLYPNTRDDSSAFSPSNFLYTDGNGNVRSTPSSNLMTGKLPSYVATGAATADGGLASGSYFKVTNGDGTSAIHVKD